MSIHKFPTVKAGSVRLTWLVSLPLVVATIVVLGPVLDHDFVTWDDYLNIVENLHFQPVTWAHVGALWQAPYEGLYIPLTYTVWAAVVWLTQTLLPGPLTASLFHRLNLLLHLGTVLVVYRVGLLLRRPGEGEPAGRGVLAAAAGALLFGVHPLQVEAVAWVSGLKDVLCGWWAVVAVWQYLASLQAPQGWRQWRHYGLATVAFGLALLSKPAAVVVPGMAGLLAVSGRGQPWRQGLKALGGWLLLALVWSVWTKGHQPDTALTYITPWWGRPVVVADTLAFYLSKFVWPVALGPDYGRTPQLVLGQGWSWLTGLGMAGLGSVLWWRRQHWAAVGMATGVFVVAMLPVSGLIPFGFQVYSTVADRYVYLAMLGPAVGLTWGLQRLGSRRTVWALALVVCVLLGWRSAGQVQVWRDTITLFTHALRINPHSALAHNNLGIALMRQGQLDKAIMQYLQALQLKPGWAFPANNLGDAMAKQGKFDEAVTWFSQATQDQPELPEAPYNLGRVLSRQGRFAEAIAAYREALRRRPHWPQAATHLAWRLATQPTPSAQEVTEAVGLATQACQASGFRHALPLRTLAVAYHIAGQEQAAVRFALQALTVAQAANDPKLVAQITEELHYYRLVEPLYKPSEEAPSPDY